MRNQPQPRFLLYTFTLFVCLNSFFLVDIDAQVNIEPVATHDDHDFTFVNVDIPSIAFLELAASSDFNYTFESIDVPGVQFLEVTSSTDFEDYAGNTRSPDGEIVVGFTLIDGVFETYHFPGAKNTYFYALGNNGQAAGHYEDSDGLHHGVILEDGELRQYDFPGAVQTFIHGISDATGALTGNYIDASGVRRGFSGDTIIEVPGASETYADFVNATGLVAGSYVDSEGIYHLYMFTPGHRLTSLNFPHAENIEYLFAHGVNQALIYVVRVKRVGDVPRTYVGGSHGLHEFQFPGSVSTEGWNINQDGSVVGYYDTADGRRHGFIARPAPDTAPHVSGDPVDPPIEPAAFTFESIDVPGRQFLKVTASSDFEDYAGYTRSPDGDKEIAFTLIDGVFKTFNFPDSQKTHFFALGNNGQAAGHYEDSDGLYHGVIVEPDGELRQYDFPGAVQTFIHGISDATGALTGNYIDASGVRRGFSGDIIVEFPGASETYAEFVNEHGSIVGSYVDAEGIYEAYVRTPDERFLSLDYTNRADLHFTGTPEWEFIFLHGISDVGVIVARSKAVGDVPRTYVGGPEGLHELRFPGSLSTEGYNINQDGSIVGHYVSTDGRIHGFIARPVDKAVSDYFGNSYNVTLDKGLNMISVPLAPPTPMSAKSIAGLTGATTVITLDAANQRFIAWTPSAPDDGFPIEGGGGYIVNVPETRQFAFVGAPWTNLPESAATAPAITPLISGDRGVAQEAWAFVVSGRVGEPKPYEGKPASEWLASAVENPVFDGYQVLVRNLRTNSTITAPVQGDYFAAATADLSRQSVVQVGDVIEVYVTGPGGVVESQTLLYKVTPEHLANAVMSVRLGNIGKPKLTQLLQNYPNPFNPETWIPYHLARAGEVTLTIYDARGGLVRQLDLGYQDAGSYTNRTGAAHWDGRNQSGEPVASGVYFYRLSTGDYSATRRMLILK